MTDLPSLLESLPVYAKDVKLNLSTLFSEENSAGLSPVQIWVVALACVYAIKHQSLIQIIEISSKTILDESHIVAAKAAASMMAMNNIYYRFTHLVSDKSYGQMHARLRMSIIANPGIAKVDFELACLAVSAINGCGLCIDAHVNVLSEHQVTKEMIQQAIRIASVLNSVGQVLLIENH